VKSKTLECIDSYNDVVNDGQKGVRIKVKYEKGAETYQIMLHSNNVACEILKCYCLKISNDKEG
jgi:hypothetical protein